MLAFDVVLRETLYGRDHADHAAAEIDQWLHQNRAVHASGLTMAERHVALQCDRIVAKQRAEKRGIGRIGQNEIAEGFVNVASGSA